MRRGVYQLTATGPGQLRETAIAFNRITADPASFTGSPAFGV